MKLLLDTHVWIWSCEEPEKLGAKTRKALVNPSGKINVSAVSTLEIARLCSLGRLELRTQLQNWLSDSVRELRAEGLFLTDEIALEAYRLPGAFHADPADRILVATARVHGLTFVTADQAILRYPHASIMDARV